ncbi:hypothetical protein Ae201684_002322 [Aphanomyces euteiches]|uniref:Uncharacterized protein n=1 Tax=Aphanomyces euteiches TaxID=100861 RepID=A0A6G0XR03_9STRA|nr:hypothetical protein Ae201684_002322 [Aphanomyces euteiches]
MGGRARKETHALAQELSVKGPFSDFRLGAMACTKVNELGSKVASLRVATVGKWGGRLSRGPSRLAPVRWFRAMGGENSTRGVVRAQANNNQNHAPQIKSVVRSKHAVLGKVTSQQ